MTYSITYQKPFLDKSDGYYYFVAARKFQAIFVKGFTIAWVKYYSTNGDASYQCYHHYMPFITTSTVNGKQITEDTTKTYKETFKHNVLATNRFVRFCSK